MSTRGQNSVHVPYQRKAEMWLVNMDFLVNHICLTRRECPFPQHVLGDRKFIRRLGEEHTDSGAECKS